MTNFLRWAAGTLVLAVLVHFAVIFTYPYIAMNRLMAAVAREAGGSNHALYPPRPDHRSRRVVRPSPDLLYVICVFDVSKGPVHVRGPVVNSYWSLSLFAANSDNFFAVSEAPAGAEWANAVLAAPGTDVSGIPYPIITPPGTRGIALYRMLIDSEKRLPFLNHMRRRAGCGPYIK